MKIDNTKLVETMTRLKVAHENNFPFSTIFQLMIEAMIAMCESQVQTSEAVVETIQASRNSLDKLMRQVEKLAA